MKLLMKLSSLFLCLISLVISLYIAEITLRNFIVLPGSSFDYRIPHPIFGWSLKPNAAYKLALPEETVLVHYNSQGYRDAERSLNKPKDVIRILVLGDSFMEGYSVNIQDSLPYLLEEFLNNEGKRVEILNMGVGGYGTLQEYLVLEEVGKGYDPDIVIVGFYVGNDLANNNYSLQLKTFSDDPNNPKVSSRPFLRSSSDDEWVITQVDYEGALGRYKEALESRSWLRHESALFITVKHAIELYFSDEGSEGKEIRGQKQDRYAAVLPSVSCRADPGNNEAWLLTKRIFNRMLNSVDMSGGQLVVFSVPTMYEVNQKTGTREIKGAPSGENPCIEDAPVHKKLEMTLTDLGIPFIGLLPIFRAQHHVYEEGLYRVSDEHWNQNGHRLAAEELSASLLSSGLLE
jgi:hypothetical protein